MPSNEDLSHGGIVAAPLPPASTFHDQGTPLSHLSGDLIERTSIRDVADELAHKITDDALQGRLARDNVVLQGRLGKEQTAMRPIGTQDQEGSLQSQLQNALLGRLEQSRDKISQEGKVAYRLGVAHIISGIWGSGDAIQRYFRDTEWWNAKTGRYVQAHAPWPPLIQGLAQGAGSLLIGAPLHLWNSRSLKNPSAHLDNALTWLANQGALASEDALEEGTYERSLSRNDVTAEIADRLVRSAEQPYPKSNELVRKFQEGIDRLSLANREDGVPGASLSPQQKSEIAAEVAKKLRASGYLKVHRILKMVGIHRSREMGRAKNINASSALTGSFIQLTAPWVDALVFRGGAAALGYFHPPAPYAWNYTAAVVEAVMVAPAGYEVYAGVRRVKAFKRTARVLDETQKALDQMSAGLMSQ